MNPRKIFFPSLLILAFTLLIGGCAFAPLEGAVRHGDVMAAQQAIDQGADVNEANSVGFTPLMLAVVLQNNKDMVRLLLDKGADPNKKSGYDRNTTPRMAIEPDLVRCRKGKMGLLETEVSCKNRILIAQMLEEAERDGPPQEKAKFEQAAKMYREAAARPAFPEEARRYKVQAEAAVRDKQFKNAADAYRKALDVAPWWPEGYFNRAIVLGEIKSYPGAIREMKRYLVLVPNAPDARAAQDRIYEWEGKEEKTVQTQGIKSVVEDKNKRAF